MIGDSVYLALPRTELPVSRPRAAAAVDARGRVRGRRGGLLKAFAETLKPEDRRIRSLRGVPFWEAACHNFLKDLRLRIAEPGTQSEVEPDPEQPGRLVLILSHP